MRTLERGQDKIQRICDKIRHETIEPAKEEAQSIITAAKKKPEEIVREASHQAEYLIKQAKAQIEQERSIFHASLEQAAHQAVEGLKQELESKFFNEELEEILKEEVSKPEVIAKLINGVVSAIEREGIRTDLMAVIPRSASPKDVAGFLLQNVNKRLENKPLELGNFNGGAQVRLINQKMTIDLTDQALKELLAHYMRKDFRHLIFGS
jgi:V/A-type H+-transporting ATPase subunit E